MRTTRAHWRHTVASPRIDQPGSAPQHRQSPDTVSAPGLYVGPRSEFLLAQNCTVHARSWRLNLLRRVAVGPSAALRGLPDVRVVAIGARARAASAVHIKCSRRTRSRNDRKPPIKLQFYGQFFLTPYRSVNGLTTTAIWTNLKKVLKMGGFSIFDYFFSGFINQFFF